MKEYLWPVLENARNLEEVLNVVIAALEQVRQNGEERIGYAAGILTSDGPEHEQRNLAVLAEHTERLGKMHGYPIISATQIFRADLLTRVKKTGVTSEQFMNFWRDILNSGYVTDIFMTPRWEQSIGAKDEHATAKKNKLSIHYLDEKPTKEES